MQVYVINPNIIKYIKRNTKMDMTDLFSFVRKKHKITAFQCLKKLILEVKKIIKN